VVRGCAHAWRLERRAKQRALLLLVHRLQLLLVLHCGVRGVQGPGQWRLLHWREVPGRGAKQRRGVLLLRLRLLRLLLLLQVLWRHQRAARAVWEATRRCCCRCRCRRCC
jgi:hypothetical protein